MSRLLKHLTLRLDPIERLTLREVVPLHQERLRSPDYLAGLHLLLEGIDLLFQNPSLTVTPHCDRDRRKKLISAKWFPDIGEDACGIGPCYHFIVCVTSQEHYRGKALFAQNARRFKSIHLRHHDIHDNEVGMKRTRKLDSLLTVLSFANDIDTEFLQDNSEVETSQGLVVSDKDFQTFHEGSTQLP